MNRRKWLYLESKLAEVTGLSRAQLKTCRIKGEYKSGKGKGGPVQLSQKGVDSVLEKYGIKDANLDGARIKGSGESQPARGALSSGAGVTASLQGGSLPNTKNEAVAASLLGALPDLKLVHVSQLVPNKRILRAQNGTGEIYNVIVPSSESWAVGDPMKIKPSQQHQGYWQLEGKAPRWRGDRIYRHEFV